MFAKVLPPGTPRALVATNTGAQLLGKVVGAATTFAVSLVVAGQFGATGYGDFVKITTYVAFFFLVSDFGINAIYLKKPTADMWQALLGLRLIGSVFLIFLALAILVFLPQGGSDGYTGFVRLGIVVFSFAIFFQAMLTSANALFQQHLRYSFSTLSISAGSAVTIFFLWLVWRGLVPGPLGGILALLMGSATTAIVAFLFLRQFTPSVSPIFRIKPLTSLLVPSVPLGLTLLFNLVYGHIDSVILTLTRTTSEVGLYGLAYKVFEVPLVLPTFFMNAVYPLLVKSDRRFLILLKRSLVVLLVASVISFFVLWFAAPLLVFIRADFSASVPALRVLILGLPFFFASAAIMWALIALGKQWLLAALYGLSMLVSIGLNAVFIPAYGYMAAAWVTVVGEAVVFTVSGLVLLKILRKGGAA